MEPTVTRIPGVFPFVDIEYDENGWARKVTVKGTMDELVVEARSDATLTPWLDVKFNGEEKTLSE